MIRSAVLALFFIPALASAAAARCGAPILAPLPASVPVPEMLQHVSSAIPCPSLEAFTARLRQPAPAPQRAATAPASGAYVPKTQHDNSPWRFDMNQNGRRMTAEEFDAWMKAKGIRVATGKPGANAPAAAAPAAAPKCTPSASVKC